MRETRVTGIASHILIGLSLLMLPYPLAYIPTAVLNGLFLYMAVTSLNGNQMFERITLLFMEQVTHQITLFCKTQKIGFLLNIIYNFCQMSSLPSSYVFTKTCDFSHVQNQLLLAHVFGKVFSNYLKL